MDLPQKSNLTESLQTLLAETQKPTPNFTEFTAKFHEFTQSELDPPLESIWVYAALTFDSQNSTNKPIKDRISAVKDLFGLVTSLSASFSGVKCVALMAPVVYEAYRVAVECNGKAIKEIRAFVDVMIGYVGLCCDGELSLGACLDDLVRVWIGSGGAVESFYPLVGDAVCGTVGRDLEYLVGVVIAEVFLLKLCLSFRGGGERAELERELRSWAVGSITAFKNSYFFEILLRMLLESALPVTSLLGSEDEALLRKILLDATVLVNYSFLNPHTAAYPPLKNMKSLAMASVIVTHDAVESFRKQGKRSKAISYLKAFSSSCLPSELIKCGSSQIRLEEKAGNTFKSSPKTLLMWLLKLEATGVRVFDDTISTSRAKLNLDVSKADEYSMFGAKTNEIEDSDLFYIVNMGEEDGEESNMANDDANAALVVAPHSMRSSEKRGSKRKEKENADMKKQIKFSKYEFTEHTGTHRVEPSSESDDDSNNES